MSFKQMEKKADGLEAAASVEWANSLVGRDWEIFWTQKDDDDDEKKSSTNNEDDEDDENNSNSSKIQDKKPRDSRSKMDIDCTPESKEDNRSVNSKASFDDENVAMADGVLEAKSTSNRAALETKNTDDDNDSQSEGDEDDDDNEDDNEDCQDVEDWYYGHVVSYVRQKGGSFLFKVSFVGDDDTIYDMELDPTLVRPSAQAWIKRSKAILSAAAAAAATTKATIASRKNTTINKNKTQFSFEAWEIELPKDTSSIDDNEILTEIRNNLHLDKPVNSGSIARRSNSKKQQPSPEELGQIKRLLYITQAQIHLRSRLARIVTDEDLGNHNKTDRRGGNKDDLVPKETVVNYFLMRLEELEAACQWYCKCWRLHNKIFSSDSIVDSSFESASSDHGRIAMSEFQEKYLEFGRGALCGLVSMDLNNITNVSAGSKRYLQATATPTAPNGTRRTKRRKRQRQFLMRDNNNDDDLDDYDEFQTEVLSVAGVDRLVKRVCANETRWYLHHFAKMMESLAHQIWEPLLKWTREADKILGTAESGDLDMSERGSESTNRSSGGSSDGNDDSDASSEEERIPMFSYADIESCLGNVQSCPILHCFNLDEWGDKLKQKLAAIKSFATDAWDCISNVACQEGDGPRSDFKHDPILNKLEALVEAANPSSNHQHAMANVEPLGETLALPLTRDILDDAITVRVWILDIWHAELVRERLQFLKGLISKASDLPVPLPLPDGASCKRLHGQFDAIKTKAQNMLLNFEEKYASTCAKYEEVLAETQQSEGVSNPLCSVEGALSALKELGSFPFITDAEEMLAVRVDVLSWRERSQRELRNGVDCPQFTCVAELKSHLDAILAGKSPTQVATLKDVQPTEQVDARIRSFALREVDLFCRQLVDDVNSLYTPAAEWRSRADAIIKLLRMHGNAVVGLIQTSSRKEPAMVDLKRVNDLVVEYETLGVALPEPAELLSKVLDAANKWSQEVHSAVRESQLVNSECLERLKESRTLRPKGLLMDPTRNVVDLMIDVLSWHELVKEVLSTLADYADKQVSGEEFSELIVDCTYSLLREGAEIIELFSERSGAQSKFKANARTTVDNLAKLQDSHRPSRILSRSKLEANALGKAVLDKIVDSRLDQSIGSPLVWMLFFSWRVSVILLIGRLNDDAEEQGSDVTRPSLIGAKQLLSSQPLLPDSVLLQMAKTGEVAMLEELIRKGEQVEAKIKTAVAGTKDLLRGSFEKQDFVRHHLASLKELQAHIKESVAEGSCLVVSSLLEQQLDALIKDVTWLVRTFPYPCLHTDDLVYQDNGGIDDRVPLDVLVGLFEKIPRSATENLGDVARVAFRVKELHESALRWQEDVSRLTSLSNRGAKRRAPGSSPLNAKGQRSDAIEVTAQVDSDKVQKLGQHPILSKVAMPREGAVRSVVANVTEFEAKLHDFLGNDFEGAGSDMARYPEAVSLVGQDGEFLLYRLTGSPLFVALKSSMEALAQLSRDVLADTPGKASFEWIQRAVGWIEALRDSVSQESTVSGEMNRLAIPVKEARRILTDGQRMFQDIPDDLRKTFSKHKIILSTNKQTEKLSVVVGKGGALHSIGGTAIRWCPLLLECLKADVAKLNEYEANAVKLCKEVAANCEKHQGKPSTDEDVYNLYKLQEEVYRLLEEGPKLVVSAPETLAQNVSRLLVYIQSSLGNCSNNNVSRKTAEKRYNDGQLLVGDREVLLGSLLSRHCFEKHYEESSKLNYSEVVGNHKGLSFRDNCRTILQKALERGMQMMGIDHGVDKLPDDTLFCFCALKALEIEACLFDLYQTHLGEGQLSEEYRNKARSLRYNLENPGNPTLCSRVLLGVITASDLVHMTPEQLASQKIQQDRARAAEEAVRFKTLTPMITVSKNQVSSLQETKQLPETTADDLGATKRIGPPVVTEPTTSGPSSHEASSSLLPEISKVEVHVGNKTDGVALREGASDVEQSLSQAAWRAATINAVATHRPAKYSALRPPPPPSLAMAPHLSDVATATKSNKGPLINNANGGNRFTFKIPDISVTFVAGLLLEDESQHQGDINFFIPEVPKNKGRLPADEFSNFLSSKLHGGKWAAVALRLSTFSELDSMEYKKFYKEYEKKNRISMFELGGGGDDAAVAVGSKLFLVTPRFHAAAKALRNSLTNRTSTYAVVLTRWH